MEMQNNIQQQLNPQQQQQFLAQQQAAQQAQQQAAGANQQWEFDVNALTEVERTQYDRFTSGIPLILPLFTTEFARLIEIQKSFNQDTNPIEQNNLSMGMKNLQVSL